MSVVCCLAAIACYRTGLSRCAVAGVPCFEFQFFHEFLFSRAPLCLLVLCVVAVCAVVLVACSGSGAGAAAARHAQRIRWGRLRWPAAGSSGGAGCVVLAPAARNMLAFCMAFCMACFLLFAATSYTLYTHHTRPDPTTKRISAVPTAVGVAPWVFIFLF